MTVPEANLVESDIRASLSGTGTLTGTIQEVSHGQSAVALKRHLDRQTRLDFEKMIEAWSLGL